MSCRIMRVDQWCMQSEAANQLPSEEQLATARNHGYIYYRLQSIDGLPTSDYLAIRTKDHPHAECMNTKKFAWYAEGAKRILYGIMKEMPSKQQDPKPSLKNLWRSISQDPDRTSNAEFDEMLKEAEQWSMDETDVLWLFKVREDRNSKFHCSVDELRTLKPLSLTHPNYSSSLKLCAAFRSRK
eukprot:GILK01007301.1.p1 GENE.GILK01007301.1~~GILK01007301.1.p1  ORF type:complete len:184 (-),score=17.71 GILK01007301.1:87-638(-)